MEPRTFIFQSVQVIPFQQSDTFIFTSYFTVVFDFFPLEFERGKIASL